MQAVATLDRREADQEVAREVVQELARRGDQTVQAGVTLPPQAYVSQAFYDLEVENIFKKSWLCVGHVSQVRKVGDYFTLELFNEPMVIVRGKDRIRALSTVCRHRWAPVAQGAGNARVFSCPFHKWTYALDGALIGAPLMGEAEDFDMKSCRLPEFRSEVVEDLGLIFVSFDDAIAPAAQHLASLCERVRAEGWRMKDQVVVSKLEQENQYNWKVQVETYVECYHHIGGHLTTLEKLLPAALTSCEADKGSWTICNVRITDELDSLGEEDRMAAKSFAPGSKAGDIVGHIIAVYPSTLFTFMVGGCDIRILSPTGPTSTRSTILTTREPEQLLEPEFQNWLVEFNETADIINKEDNDINMMQQVGVSSERAEAGRFSHLEACAWHLARYVRGRLAEA